MIRSTIAHVDLGALADNFRNGHGAPAVARALEAAGASMVACADIEEAITLREAGVRCRILVFGALSLSALDGIFDFDLVPTISTPKAGFEVARAAARRAARVRYHLKIDTGMNRLGFRHDNLRRTIPPLLAEPTLRLEAVYTHFATADMPGDPFGGGLLSEADVFFVARILNPMACIWAASSAAFGLSASLTLNKTLPEVGRLLPAAIWLLA